jgi:hypothetical protein
MYCPSCGFQNVNEVRFCNRCGLKLKSAGSNEKGMSDLLTKFLTTIGSVTLAGIGFPMFAMMVLGKRGFPPQILLLVAIACFAATIAIDGLLVWLMLRVMRLRQEEAQSTTHERITNGLSQPQISSPTTFSSVTEHTTRNFDPLVSRVHRGE